MEKKRKYSKDGSEHVTTEVFNSASHLIGAVFALFGLTVLVVKAAIAVKPWQIVSFSIYGTSLFMLFLFSSLHHGVDGKKKTEELLRLFDYIAIFPLIAGTFTPFCLVLLRDNPFGWSIFGVVWVVAIIGIVIKASFSKLPQWVILTLYIALGWFGAILVLPLLPIVQWHGIAFIALGGVFYTVGAVIFAIEKPNPIPGIFGFHEIWHIFVLLGAAAHYFVIYFYVLSP